MTLQRCREHNAITCPDCGKETMNEERLRTALTVAKETVDGWQVDEHGLVHVHKDVITKAINAAIAALDD